MLNLTLLLTKTAVINAITFFLSFESQIPVLHSERSTNWKSSLGLLHQMTGHLQVNKKMSLYNLFLLILTSL